MRRELSAPLFLLFVYLVIGTVRVLIDLLAVHCRDDERKRKLMALMSSLADQEGDFKRMKRQK